jgi:hypothetical protein
MNNPRDFPNGVTTEAQTPFQSGTGMCTCCSAAKYYEHPVSPFWGGANKKRTNKKSNNKNGGACSLARQDEVVTANQQNGAVLYGGAQKRGRGRPRKNQNGGAGCDTKSLIPVNPSTPADLSGQGPFTDQHADWMQRGTGSGVPETRDALPEGAFSTAIETSGGARKTNKKNNSKKADKKKTNKKNQKGGDALDNALTTGLTALQGGKRGRGRPRKNQNGGGSDWVTSVHSLGPINYPQMSNEMLRTFTKTADVPSNADLYWAPLKSPMFSTDAPVGYNNYTPY